MNYLSICDFYCLSYYTEKRDIMREKFNKLNINCNFCIVVNDNNDKINNDKINNDKINNDTINNDKINNDTINNEKNDIQNNKSLSIMYSHIEIINYFYNNSNTKYAIICEDDIIIHKDIKTLLRKVLIDFNILGLDILLLSYMIPYKITIEDTLPNYPLKREMPSDSYYKYHDYPINLSGTQMYMITKEYAKHILDKLHDSVENLYEKYFTIDSLLLYDGNKALLYPMLAIENEEQEDKYHQLCHKIHFDECFV